MCGVNAEAATAVGRARKVLEIEAEGLLRLAERVDGRFEDMVTAVCAAGGRVIVAGIGKSGIIGRKIVATLNSTGTRALFLHPVEAMHGDLGMVCPDDVFLALSNSGETDELNLLIPTIRAVGCVVIAFTGNAASTLARNADIVIDTGVEREACPMGLAPTASTTAQMAMGDALAAALIDRKRFNPSDFKKFHPGGALGQRLSKKVSDFMLSAGLPLVRQEEDMAGVVTLMDRVGLGVALVVKPDGTLSGIVTDGDLRRRLARKEPILEMSCSAIMTRRPKTVRPDSPAYDALNLMESFEITVLPVTSESGVVLGVLHLHDILGKGSFTFNGT